MNLEQAWKQDEEQVDALIKSAKRYVAALKAWKKASQFGHFANRQKASALAEDLAGSLAAPTSTAVDAWTFDIRAFLESDSWQTELLEAAQEKYGMKTMVDGETLVSSPVIVRSLPARNLLQIGKTTWPNLRPLVVAAELKKLRDRAGASNSQEFLDSLYAMSARFAPADVYMKFRDIYDIFALTPGWKKENPEAAFAQAIYALHRSDVRAARGGKTFEFIYPSGNVKEKDVFGVISEDGRQLRYYGIRFAKE